jgi:hypothetical protein
VDEPVVEPDAVLDELVEESVDAPVVEPEAAMDDIVDNVTFDELNPVSNFNDIGDIKDEFNNLDDIADTVAPVVEMSAVADDDFDNTQPFTGLDKTMENENKTSTAKDGDEDWMAQLEGLDDVDQTGTKDKVSLEKEPEEDWMKQLDDAAMTDNAELPGQVDLDEHDEETAKKLMDAGHDYDEDTNLSKDFDIAEKNANKNVASAGIDEEALIAKAVKTAVTQSKENQDNVVLQIRADQDKIEANSRKQLSDLESKRKKTALFGSVALGVGVLGLVGSGAVGWLTYETKTNAETTNETVIALEDKVNTFLAKNTDKEIDTLKASVEQLNQKVEKILSEQAAAAQAAADAATAAENIKSSESAKTAELTKKTAELTKTGTPVNLLNSKAISPAAVGGNGKTAHTASDHIAPLVETPKIPEAEIVPIEEAHVVSDSKATEAAKKAANDDKAKAEAKAKSAAKSEADKTAAKAEAESFSQKLAKANEVAKAASAPVKTEEQRKLLEEVDEMRYSGKMTRGMARGIEKERQENAGKNKVATAARSKKEASNLIAPADKTTAMQKMAGKYSVNVVSYQQEWYAQSKAAEFKQKGIPVEVSPVDINNYATRYRLKVTGFKTKNEANDYAEKIKREHNLNETWVGVSE